MTSPTDLEKQADEWLIIMFGEHIAFEYRTTGSKDTIIVGGTEFTDIRTGNFLGFYDWLIAEDGGFIGITFYPFSLKQIMPRFNRPTYVAVDDDQSMHIFFRDAREFDPQKSVVQCFSGTRCFEAATGTYCLAFGLLELDDDQKRRLESQASQSMPP